MWGTVLLTCVIFLILVVVTRAAGYYRRTWSVADSGQAGGDDATVSGAVGIGSAVVVLLLLLLLYLGITRWDWAGHPIGGVHGVSTPAPLSSPGNPAVVPSASASAAASPSAKTSP